MQATLSTAPDTRMPSTPHLIRLIAWRAAIESLRDRTTLLVSAFFSVAFPTFVVLTSIRPAAARATTPQQEAALGGLIAVYLFAVGLLPTSTSTGVAAGLFAGEKEQGNLAPLLASPASNIAIFGGKVLGAVIPAIFYALVAEALFIIEIAVLAGPEWLRRIPLVLALSMVGLVPAVAVFGATVASLISSRVRTYNSAQQISSFVLVPVLFAFVFLGVNLQTWGAAGPLVAVLATAGVDVALITIAARTWRREEVLARQ
ncbi:MAG TPA: ABC transporter permease [Ktedonobacterales bacterium]|nr:ABC transporter permease [Ktedonobacterales bacterium]